MDRSDLVALGNLTDDLHKSVAAVCPIAGITIRDPNDQTTWSIQFDPSATPAQQQAAQAVITNYNIATVPSFVDQITLLKNQIFALQNQVTALNKAVNIIPVTTSV